MDQVRNTLVDVSRATPGDTLNQLTVPSLLEINLSHSFASPMCFANVYLGHRHRLRILKAPCSAFRIATQEALHSGPPRLAFSSSACLHRLFFGRARVLYKPSLPVLLALAPPIGNWLTGGDYVKDLLLLLLVFYLHRLVEVPWNLYYPVEHDIRTGEQARARSLAHSELHLLELFLLIALSTPLPAPPRCPPPLACLVHFLLFGSASATPISWFSVLLAALHSSRASLRVPAPCTKSSMLRYRLPPTLPILLLPTDANRGIESQTRRLESTLRLLRKDNKEAIQAVETYVEGALAPLEDGVRRMERRVAKLRTSEKVKEGGEGFGGKRCCVCGSDEQVVEVIPEESGLSPTSSSTCPSSYSASADAESESCENFGFSNGDNGTTVMRSARAGSPLDCVMAGFCAASGG
ncbi:hypothetical protein B0H11DRAFT_2234285 [Mycena galericulata]|nr:hypothetical protein B0H11DRAFT_2234285 [Mycena galericulata]